MPEIHPWRPFRLADSAAQKRLEQLASTKRGMDVREAFAADSARLESLTEELPGLYLKTALGQ
ncbi:MAG: hypothetical protein ACPG66_09820 [Flavobacteriales bacterium]